MNNFLHHLLVMVCYLASVFHSWYSGGITLLMVQGYSLLSLFILIASACLSCSDFLFVPAWCVPWCFLYPLLDSGFSLYVAKRALSSLSSLRYISSVLFRLGVLLVILLSPWLLSHFSIAKLRQADYRKYRWHYLLHKKIGNLPHFYVFRSPKVGIPFFFLEIICLCSFLAHFWIAL